MGEESSPARPRRTRFKIVLAGGTLCVFGAALYAVEIHARGVLEEDVPAMVPTTFSGLTPYSMFGIDPFDAVTLERSPYFEDYRWAEAPDAVVLGGSTAAGAGVRAVEDAYFTRASALTELRIESAGYPGYMSSQELLLVTFQILPRRPQHVISLGGYNDVILAPAEDLPPGYPTNWRGLQVRVEHPEYACLAHLARAAGFPGLGGLYWHRRIGAGGGPQQWSPNSEEAIARERELRPRRFEIWANNITAMARLCDAAGIAFTCVAQPNGYAVGARFKFYPWNAAEEERYGRDLWPAFVQFARDTCERERITFLDATTAVSPEHFIDPAHFNAQGHEELAQALAAHLNRDAPA